MTLSIGCRPPLVARAAHTMAGQALTELLLVLGVLSVVIGASHLIGTRVSVKLSQDQYTRWMAFSALPGEVRTSQGPRLKRSLLGDSADFNDIRRSWAYDDGGMIVARSGSRHIAVLRDAGYRGDNAQTQSRLGESRAAWRAAFDRTRRIANRINGQAKGIDAAWRRPSLTLDWLSAWADLEPQRVRK